MSQHSPPDDELPQSPDPTGPGATEQGPGPSATEQEPAPGATEQEPGLTAADQEQAGDTGEAGSHTPESESGQHSAAGRPAARTRIVVGAVFVVLCLGVAGFFAVVGPASAAEPGLLGAVMRWATPVIWVALAGVAAAWAAGASRKVINAMASVVLGFYLLYLIARSL